MAEKEEALRVSAKGFQILLYQGVPFITSIRISLSWP
jgi:hypothetical protein